MFCLGSLPNPTGPQSIGKKHVSPRASVVPEPLEIHRIPRMPTEKEAAQVFQMLLFLIDNFYLFIKRFRFLMNYHVHFVKILVLVIIFVVVFVRKHIILNVFFNVVILLINHLVYHVLQNKIGVVQNV